MFFAERSRTKGFRPGRECTLFISKSNINRNIKKVLPLSAGERKEKTAEPPRAPSLRRADASQALKSTATKQRRRLTNLRNGGKRRRAPTALPFLPTIRRFPALPQKPRRIRLFPKRRTSPCRPSPKARPSPFRRTFFGSRAAILHSPPPDRDAPSAERFQLPALLCDCRLRRNSLTSRPQSFGTFPVKPSATPRLRDFDALRRRISSALPPPTGFATSAPNLPCPAPGDVLLNFPPAARPATPAALPSTLRHGLQRPPPSDARSAERLRTRDAPRPRSEIPLTSRQNLPGYSGKSPGAELLLFAFSAAIKKARLSLSGKTRRKI